MHDLFLIISFRECKNFQNKANGRCEISQVTLNQIIKKTLQNVA